MTVDQEVIFSNDVSGAIDVALGELSGVNRVFVLTDVNTSQAVFPRLADCRSLSGATLITIPAGDDNKNLQSLNHVWTSLQAGGATRRSALINLGGGVVTDLGGFAAATFKRGIAFVNVPTTLLAAVDAAVGGKTGINFNSMKNEVGAFAPARAVIISTMFFDTLPDRELRSGYAEMLKHAMLTSDAMVDELLNFDLSAIDSERLLEMLKQSVAVKQEIVRQDPLEQGLRRALNFGHTAGHAFESHALKSLHPVPHGYAVAWGMVVELVLSHLKKRFPSTGLHRVSQWVKENYGIYEIDCDDYPELLELMRHDKKSRAGEINCTLLPAFGEISIDNTISADDMTAALDIYRDLMGI